MYMRVETCCVRRRGQTPLPLSLSPSLPPSLTSSRHFCLVLSVSLSLLLVCVPLLHCPLLPVFEGVFVGSVVAKSSMLVPSTKAALSKSESPNSNS